MPRHTSEDADNPEDTIKGKRRKKSRQEVDVNDILPEDTARSRRGSEKQRHISMISLLLDLSHPLIFRPDEETEDANRKKIQRLTRELAKYKTAAKAKKVVLSDDDSDSRQDKNDIDWDADFDGPESEDEEDSFQTPFHSKGVIASTAPKRLKRRSQKSASPEPIEMHVPSTSRASSMSGVSIPPSSSPSVGNSSRSSSRLSQQRRSQSPFDNGSHDLTGQTRTRSRYDRELDSRSPSPPLAGTLGRATVDTSQQNKTRRRGRSPESPTTQSKGDAARKKQRTRSSDSQQNQSASYDLMLYAGDKVPVKARPKDSDYARPIRNLIKLAVKKYLLHIFTENAFPDEETATLWASTAWSTVCGDTGKSFSPKDNERIHTLLINRASSARGHLRDELKPLVISHFHLKSETLKSEVRNENIKIIRKLMEGVPPQFCYKDLDGPDGPRGYAELRFPLQALHTQLFRERDHIGNEESTAFNPLPLPTLALVLTIVEYCLDAWTDGRYNNSLKLDDKHYRPKYESHLAQLQHYHTLNPPVFTKIRKRMFDRICHMMKTPIASDTSRKVISDAAQKRAKAELDNRTGDTDSGDEIPG
ncbi:hypothetical protein EIP86_009410, partial [Pleurotus ostreatoroseus]